MMRPPRFIDDLTNAFNRMTGHDRDRRDVRGQSALYRAVQAGNLGLVKMLLRGRADPNVSDERGLTPLHEAAYWGEKAIVLLLLQYGANPCAADQHGFTPLHAAALSGGRRARGEIVALLSAKGACDDVADGHGWTANDYMALWDENPAAAEKLRVHLTGRQRLDRPSSPPAPPKPPAA